jgi:two-component system LytT family response regulator
MDKIKTVIADDESHCRKTLTQLIESSGDLILTGEGASTADVHRLICGLRPDLAILDIQMPGESIFKVLKTIDHPPAVIFQTAYAEFALEAFGVEALDYLLKPVSPGRFQECLTRIRKHFKRRVSEPALYPAQFAVKDGGLVRLIRTPEIRSIVSEEGYSFICTAKGRFISDDPLNVFESSLDPQLFFRTSRDAIVRLDEIELIEPEFNGTWVIHLKDKSRVSLSRRRAGELRRRIQF